MRESEAQEALKQLRDLFPKSLKLPDTPSDRTGSWTPTELAIARLLSLQAHQKAGWNVDDAGVLTKGNVSKRAGAVVPYEVPNDPGYNPWLDAFAVRLGAELIDSGLWAGRYRLGDHIVDWSGQFVDTAACPECHGSPFWVRVLVTDGPPGKQAFTYCRRCVTPAMREERDRQRQALAPQQQRRQR